MVGIGSKHVWVAPTILYGGIILAMIVALAFGPTACSNNEPHVNLTPWADVGKVVCLKNLPGTKYIVERKYGSGVILVPDPTFEGRIIRFRLLEPCN